MKDVNNNSKLWQIKFNLNKTINYGKKVLSDGCVIKDKETKKLTLNFNKCNKKSMIKFDMSRKNFKNAIKPINESDWKEVKYKNACFMAKDDLSEAICPFGDLVYQKEMIILKLSKCSLTI